MQWFQRLSHLNGLNARVDINCEQPDRCMDGRTDVLMDRKRTPVSHPAGAGATKKSMLM